MFYSGEFWFFLPCGTMSPWKITCAGHMATSWALEAIVKTSIAWTRGQTILNQSTCAKSGLSGDDWRLTLRHVASQGVPDLHQIKCSAITIRRPRSNSIFLSPWRYVDTAWRSNIHRTGEKHIAVDHDYARLDGWHASRKRSTRPRFDRTMIAARSHRDPGSITVRSWLDHDAIVARLNRDRGSSVAKSWHTISSLWWATIVVKSWPLIGSRQNQMTTIFGP